MKRIKKIIILLFVSLLYYSCTNANAVVNKSKSSAFDKIDKRDKKLFTKQERIESYNNSRNKLTNVKAALTAFATGTDTISSDLIPYYDVSAGVWEKV